jgi:Cu/Ag efflux protein CusF
LNSLSKLAVAAAITFSSASLAFAQEAHGGAQRDPSSQVAQNAATPAHKGGVEDQMVDGEVRKVDKEAGKITLRHGELKNLDMPAMTMVFRVKDPAMLEQVKPGDKVRFVAEKVGGAFTLVQMDNVK